MRIFLAAYTTNAYGVSSYLYTVGVYTTLERAINEAHQAAAEHSWLNETATDVRVLVRSFQLDAEKPFWYAEYTGTAT